MILLISAIRCEGILIRRYNR